MGENRPDIVEQFRLKRDSEFRGDSGINSLGDLVACQLGFVVIHCTWLHLPDHCKWRFTLLMSLYYEIGIGIILFLWFCDGTIPIWCWLSGLHRFNTCGPNFIAVMLALATSLVCSTVIA